MAHPHVSPPDIRLPVPPVGRAVPPLLSIITHCHSIFRVTQQKTPPAATSGPVSEVGCVLHGNFFLPEGLRPGWDLLPALQHADLQPESGRERMGNAAPSISPALQRPVLPSAASLARAGPCGAGCRW